MQIKNKLTLIAVSVLCSSSTAATCAELVADITIHGDKPAAAISPTLYGIFYEDINYAGDGGLYAELVQNRSFEYRLLEPGKFSMRNPKTPMPPLFSWMPVERNGMTCQLAVSGDHPLNSRNPHYVTLNLAGAGVAGIANTGYDGGITIQAGAAYDISLYARRSAGDAAPLTVSLETPEGAVLAKTTLAAPVGEWAKRESVLTVTRAEPKARLVVTTTNAGTVDLDMVSLFPRDTFKGRKNGLRKDLAEAIAAIRPKTLRFPGGCIVHGNGLANAYRWKDTVGDVAARKPNWNRWGYHQSYGLGYFEYMQFAEDIGATPLPILPGGVSCGFSKPFEFSKDSELSDWIQDCVDLVEFANGPVNSTWGKVRADMGHPASFNLKFIGIGNEEHDTPEFRAIFPKFVTAMREKCPEIQIVGTSGLGPKIPLFDLMAATGVEISDEHYYMPPEWFVANRNRFDTVARKAPKVYVGEYASQGNTLFNAVAEAVYLAGIERNSDQVVMTAYAPLLARYGFTQWQKANLIWFDAERLVKTPNYHVQQLFSSNLGDHYLTNEVTFPAGAVEKGKPPILAVSPTLAGGKLFLKLANPMTTPVTASVSLRGLAGIQPQAQLITLAGDKDAANDAKSPDNIAPVVSSLPVGEQFKLTVPAMSVQILRIGATAP
jgi:alpha-L-arabinofuranosidase